MTKRSKGFRVAGAMRLPCFLLLVFVAGATHAQPANDIWENREVIATLPFSDTEVAVFNANLQSGDPLFPCRSGSAQTGAHSVWYEISNGPQVAYVTIVTNGSTYDTMVAVYTGSPGLFRPVAGACNDDATGTRSRIAGLRLAPNTTYQVEVAAYQPLAAAATLVLTVNTAPVYLVNSLADTTPGACDAANCTLREAITASNAAPGAVLLPAGIYSLTRVGVENSNASGDLDVTAGMGLYGAGVANTVIDGRGLDRVLDIDPAGSNNVTAIVADLTLRNGQAAGSGGGVLLSGVSSFAGFERVALRDNRASVDGGGLRSTPKMQLYDSTVADNQAGGAGGGLSLGAGTGGTVEVRGSTVNGNTSLAAVGAGGGGIHAGAVVILDASTVSGNIANFSGGGVHAVANGAVRMRSSTVAGNVANFNGDSAGTGGGLRIESVISNVVRNSIVGDNVDLGATPAPDCSKSGAGALGTGFSILEQAAGDCVFTAAGDTVGVDAALAPLAQNGGPTTTHAISSGAAVDTGDTSSCSDFLGRPFEHDQRGAPFERNVGTACDRGAFEYQGPPPTEPSAPDLVFAFDSGRSDSDNVTNVPQPGFAGTCETGDLIRITFNGVEMSPPTVCDAGNYFVQLDALTMDATSTVRARATRGSTSTDSVGSLAFTLDRVAGPTTILAPTGNVGALPEVRGITEPLAEVQVTLSDLLGGNPIANAAGEWTFTSEFPLPEGPNFVRARCIDLAGNIGPDATVVNFFVAGDPVFADGFE